jgi:hypothetical protein
MKRGSIDHPKVKRLGRLLKLRMFGAVGILECLYHFTSEYAPDGGIGKFSDDEIADACDWGGSASNLISALSQAGLIDLSGTHRLVVHDWSEHADDGVHMKLARAGVLFADGQVPKLHRLTKEEREKCQAKLDARQTHGKRTEDVCRDVALAKPSLSQAINTPSPQGGKPSNGFCKGFLDFYNAYPLHVGKQAAYRAWTKAGKRLKQDGGKTSTEAVAYLVDRAKAFAASPKGHSEYVPNPAAWLNQGRYDDDPEAWNSSGGSSNGQPHKWSDEEFLGRRAQQ